MPPGRGSHVSSPAPAPPLPKVSFRKIDGEGVNEPAGVTDLTARSYGYNDFSTFARPDHYIRYIEPLESELTNQVEYDMDEQDQEWLDLVNEERKKTQVGTVSSEIFEILMDRLEKEWFELLKRVPKPDTGLPSEDSTCAICDDGEGENSNAIVFCDGCNLAVHQDCYGVPYIPEGQWLCRKCTVSPEAPVSCVFCPNEGGAFKQTSTALWAHLLCAMFIPEVTVGNTMFMEPIDNIDKVPKSRWKLTCSLCKAKHGACIQCDKTTCFAAFHVTCARQAKILMGMKGLSGEEAAFKGYCEKHLPEDVKKTRDDTRSSEESHTTQARTPRSSKTARAYSKKYTLGPPLVPQLIVDKLEDYYKKHFRQKTQFIQLVCKYWSLKREARRGAPLLKRLHLEPWTASTATKQQTDQEKAVKYQYLVHFRDDLENVRKLADLTRKREQQKLLQVQLLREVIYKMLFPHIAAIKHALEQIQSFDKNELFQRPVTRTEAPDYFDIINTPMCFEAIESKLKRGEYRDLDLFKADVDLVFNNAMLYNKRDTIFYKTAARLKPAAASIIESLSGLLQVHPRNDTVEGVTRDDVVGNLEANTETLAMLLSEDSIRDDTDLVIETEPIISLFRTENAVFKPPPPPPRRLPLKTPKVTKEPAKRDYKLERQRRKELLAAENAAILDASPGFRAPRATRSTRAALAALESTLIQSEHTNSIEQVLNDDGEPLMNEDKEMVAAISSPMAPTQPERTSDETSFPVKPRSWRREHLMLPGQGAPNMVESMDNHGSFKNFDRGWILPSGSRRHNRAIPEPSSSRESQPPPRKRPRTERAKSRLSIMATDPTDGTHPDALGKEHGQDTTMVSPQDSTELEHFKVKSRDSSSQQRTFPDDPALDNISDAWQTTSPDNMAIHAPHGTKRNRTSSLRSESERLDAASRSSQPRDDRPPPAPRSHKKGAKRQSLQPINKQKAPGPPRGIITEGDVLLGGTLVWAKMESYPWWAAVVWEDDTKGVPMNVLRSKASIPRTEPGPLTLVQFFDRSRSWQWLELSSLRLLGEDKELDDMLLSGRGKVQTFRTPRLRQGCRQAYREAMSEMEEPYDNDDNTNTNRSGEAASVDPGLRSTSRPQDTPADAEPSPTSESSHAFQAPYAPYEMTNLMPDFSTESMDMDMDDDSELRVPMIKPENATSPPEMRTAVSSELSELDSEA